MIYHPKAHNSAKFIFPLERFSKNHIHFLSLTQKIVEISKMQNENVELLPNIKNLDVKFKSLQRQIFVERGKK